ncbi:MAG TPA: DUF3187 family protein [Thermoanaerobaculia bacterium]|jgi:hypothetical protein|nr:DUF3187 family protein [Thermoanaerobaculia bacterium]
MNFQADKLRDRWVRISCLAVLGGLCALAPAAAAEDGWQTLGLMRVRDMTPFGISRLDMLPAHAVPATPGTFAFEVTLSYQNTWALSENVKDYLKARGVERKEIGKEDIAAIIALPGDAYLVDGEFGLVDLTLHYRTSRHVGVYATIPYFTTQGGFLDSTIESFHDAVGFSSAGREFVPRNRWLAVGSLERTTIVIDGPPDDEFGDPVFGVRYSLAPSVDRYNVVLEAATKLVLFDSDSRLVSTGLDDFGLQLSLQRFFSRNALYLSFAEVYYQSPDPGLSKDIWIPTVVAGWETRIAQHTNLILQGYFSRSAVQETTLDELSANKIQATIGIQRIYRGNVIRFGITENLANFDNTPDVGVNLSVARILFGSRDKSRRSNP